MRFVLGMGFSLVLLSSGFVGGWTAKDSADRAVTQVKEAINPIAWMMGGNW